MSDTYHQVRRLCVGFVIAAFMLTLVAVAGAALTAAAPGPGRVRFRPRLSFFGILGGLLAGLGAGVLLQQYAILYPTRTVAIIELAAGLALGILLPSLGRLRAVRRINRRLAQA
jgi:hypothetical protein